MRDVNANQLLAQIMGWTDEDTLSRYVPALQLLASYKYDSYQRFAPGRRFIESLALWLKQMQPSDRSAALDLVADHLIFFSESELLHLVQTAYPDLIVQERIRLVADELQVARHRVTHVSASKRFSELRKKSLYLGLSDGARTNDLRRASDGEISNEQIWQAYELGEGKAQDMLKELKRSLAAGGTTDGDTPTRFNLVWLIDDFSGSGNTYIRFDDLARTFKGKIPKIYKRLHQGDLIDPTHYEVYLLLYVATQQSLDHIEYWTQLFTTKHGYKPLQVRSLCVIDQSAALTHSGSEEVRQLLQNTHYFDPRANDKHMAVGGSDGRLGFADCALPVVLSHNTPNNSVYLLWGPESMLFEGLFPRLSRHREF